MQAKISVIDQAVMSGSQVDLTVQRAVETPRLEREDLTEDLRNVKITVLEVVGHHQIDKVQVGQEIDKAQVGQEMEEVLVEDEAIRSSILEDDSGLKRTLRTRGLIS